MDDLSCYRCIPVGMQWRVFIYLLQSVSGNTEAAQALTGSAACYTCIPPGERLSVIIYLIDRIGQIASKGSFTATDPNTLTDLAQCESCVGWGMILPKLILELQTTIGNTETVSQLIDHAQNYCCIPTGMEFPVILYLLDTGTFSFGGVAPVTPCRHATVDAWVTRVQANGGTTSDLAVGGAIYNALCQFCTGLDTAGLTAKMISINAFVPGLTSPATLNAELIRARTPLISPAGNNLWTEPVAFAVGDLTVAGLQGNGAKYLNTGLRPNVIWPNDLSAGVTCYVSNSSATATTEIGCGTGALLMALQNSFSVFQFQRWYCWSSGAGLAAGGPNQWAGFVSGSRRAANDSSVYRGNSTTYPNVTNLATIATTAGNRPADEIAVFARNNGGIITDQSAKCISFAAMHLGLTDAETRSFFVLVQDLRTALGGGTA